MVVPETIDDFAHIAVAAELEVVLTADGPSDDVPFDEQDETRAQNATNITVITPKHLLLPRRIVTVAPDTIR